MMRLFVMLLLVALGEGEMVVSGRTLDMQITPLKCEIVCREGLCTASAVS
jgi:hypothetical protein